MLPYLDKLTGLLGGLNAADGGGGFTPSTGGTGTPKIGVASGAGGANNLSYDQVLQLVSEKFPPETAPIMAATIMAESSGNPAAINREDPGGSYGLTQINQAAHGPRAREALDPNRAIELAYEISKGGTDFSPWSQYKSGPTSSICHRRRNA